MFHKSSIVPTRMILCLISMLRLQDLKMDLSDAALGEGTAGIRLTKMSVRELKTVCIFRVIIVNFLWLKIMLSI